MKSTTLGASSATGQLLEPDEAGWKGDTDKALDLPYRIHDWHRWGLQWS